MTGGHRVYEDTPGKERGISDDYDQKGWDTIGRP
jgi:hypothetical protein